MNIPDACEKAVATMLRKYAAMGAGVTIRCWQSLRFDGSWKESVDYTFPMIDIRFAPERVDDNQATMSCEGAVLAGTKTADDKDHAKVKQLYESVHDVLRAIFTDFYGRTNGTKYTEFETEILKHTSNGISVGGVTFSEPTAPADDAGANMIGIGFGVHISYA